MSTLHGEAVYPGDVVYDLIDGQGTVESVLPNCIWVSIGCRTKRRYSRDGFVGKRCTATLFWHKPALVRFSKNACDAEKQRRFLESTVKLMNEMNTTCSCSEAVINECPEEKTCGHC